MRRIVMKTLYTKSIQAKPEVSDGIRICIMRRPDRDALYDIWIPHLSPSPQLLDAYYSKEIDWTIYEKRFIPEVLDKETAYLDIVLQIVKKYTVTLLCFELSPEKCHRRLTAERLQKMSPELDVIYK